MSTLNVALAMLCTVYLQILGPIGPLGGKVAPKAYKALATIEAIDNETRMITVRVKNGDYHILHAGPKITRFEELKAGDTKTFKWTVPVVYEIHRTDEVVQQSTTENQPQVDSARQKPGGTPTERQSTTVTVRTIDQKVSWITVEGDDGRTMGFWVEKNVLTNVNAGNRVVISYKVGEVTSVK